MRALTRPNPEYNCNPTTEINRLRSYRDATHVDSILDRLVHNAYRIALKGESMRKLNAKGGRGLKTKS